MKTSLRFLLFSVILHFVPIAALAHAQLIGSDPAAESVIEDFPQTITLTFSEAVAPLVLRWINPEGNDAEVVASVRDAVVSVPAPEVSASGTYLLSWRVVSDDGHPVGGVLPLHLGAPSTRSETAPTTIGAQIAAASRFGLTAALLLAVGLALHTAFIAREAPSGPRRICGQIAVLGGFGLSAVFLWSHGLDLLGLDPREGLSVAPFYAALTAPLVRTIVMTDIALLLAALALSRTTSLALGQVAMLAFAAWLFAGLSFAGSGHAITAPPATISTTAVMMHGISMVWWMGLLVPLLFDLRHPEAALRLKRFSGPAIVFVALLILSGMWLTWAQSGGNLPHVANTVWGRILVVKLTFVAALLLLAALNRLKLTPALHRGEVAHLSRSIRIEIVLAVGVLFLAALFRLAPPPRALIADAPPISLHIHTDRAMADVRLSPGRAGPVVLQIGFQTGDFDILVPREVAIALTPSDDRLAPIRLRAREGDDGLWLSDEVTLPFGGSWDIAIRILITDFESVVLQETFRLPE
ncbi:copper resistance CopC/CopD family protein [Pararhodobacter sp. CCB-MM2]|uniref:copper resistance CopC/CopD family protein n=1 Tax=Pararhodobacter sp. CCB-MM2 TaxID=1786003 RepID=UPI000830163A|nr:copper resistance protein CopC [Pararhodobacter sp. CCB-MM2]